MGESIQDTTLFYLNPLAFFAALATLETKMKFDRKTIQLAVFFVHLLTLNLAAAGFEFNRSEEGVLYFSIPSEPSEQQGAVTTLKADLYDVQFLGKLDSPEGKLPYFALAAKPCANCALDRSVFFVRPSPAFKPISLTYPGKLIDPKGQGAVLESRAFLGKCLKNRATSVFVVFQKERVDRKKKNQASVFIAEAGPDHLEESFLEHHLPNVNDTLRLVKQKACREIDGRNRIIQKKPFEIKTRFKREDENDDGDEENEEKTPSIPNP